MRETHHFGGDVNWDGKTSLILWLYKWCGSWYFTFGSTHSFCTSHFGQLGFAFTTIISFLHPTLLQMIQVPTRGHCLMSPSSLFDVIAIYTFYVYISSFSPYISKELNEPGHCDISWPCTLMRCRFFLLPTQMKGCNQGCLPAPSSRWSRTITTAAVCVVCIFFYQPLLSLALPPTPVWI